MIGYVCIGTNDMARAARFYDQLTAVLGAKRIWDTERFVAWGQSPTDSLLVLIKPLDGKSATVGNGTMISLAAESKALVDAVYNKALALGGQDEGPPGARSEDFYAAYFRDSEGNKLAVYYSS
jgi:catechol 2,3-dioxygenase-like lactoylglutathione lyase family enzyme